MAAVDCGYSLTTSSSCQDFMTFMYPSQRIKRPKRSHKLNMSDENDDETSTGVRAPIVGYEVVDRREKFTVYKIQVRDREKSWFVFRRYTDFVRLNDKLEDKYPGFHFKLPAKRWFKNNFDADFIEERAHGLQFFINCIMRHSSVSKSEIVKEFLCLDDPPGPFDSLEESRAYCQQLEDEIEDVKEKVIDLTTELSATKSQLAQARVQQEVLVNSLKLERASNSLRKNSSDDSSSFQAISDGQERTKGQNGDDADQSSWMGNLEIAAHSESFNRIKPQPRKILTSTPEKESHIESFRPVNDLLKLTGEDNGEEENIKALALSNIEQTPNHTVQLKPRENESKESLSSSPKLEEFENHSSGTDDELSEITNASSNNLTSQQSSKRDSGIGTDTCLSP